MRGLRRLPKIRLSTYERLCTKGRFAHTGTFGTGCQSVRLDLSVHFLRHRLDGRMGCAGDCVFCLSQIKKT